MARILVADDDVDSPSAVLREARDMLRRNTGIDEVITRRAQRTAHKYVSGTVAEWGRRFDQARFSQDVRTSIFPRKLVQPLSESAAAYKASVDRIDKRKSEVEREAESDDDDGAAATPTATSPAAKRKAVDGGKGDGGKAGDGGKVYTKSRGGVLIIAATGAKYNFAKCPEDHKGSGKCVQYCMAVAAGISKADALAACKAVSCPRNHSGAIEGLRLSEYRMDKAIDRPKKPKVDTDHADASASGADNGASTADAGQPDGADQAQAQCNVVPVSVPFCSEGQSHGFSAQQQQQQQQMTGGAADYGAAGGGGPTAARQGGASA